MKSKELLVEFYTAAEDKLTVSSASDTRRPRLTMLHLQKLRKSRDTERYEKAQHREFLPDMYGVSGEQPSI